MKVVRFVLRLVGWLLTPFVAWAASLSGGTLVAWATADVRPTVAFWLTVAGGALAALLGLLGWLRLLRHSPRLRHALEVPDGRVSLPGLKPNEAERS